MFAHMTRPIRSRDFAPVAADELALLARLLRNTGQFDENLRTARTLLAQFGSLPAVIFADPLHLAKVDGVDERAVSELRLARTLHEDLARARIRNRPLISSFAALVDYGRVLLAEAREERFHALFLDRRNQLIADECLAIGTVDFVGITPREVIARALDHGATALILMHNHPSGDTTPSGQDIDTTRAIKEAAALFDIALHDHVIISATSALSFQADGLL